MSKFLQVCKEWGIKPTFNAWDNCIDLEGGDKSACEHLKTLLNKKENFVAAVRELMEVDEDCRYIIEERAGICECDIEGAILCYFKNK